MAETQIEDHRPWGYFRVLADEADHKVKRIVVYPGQRLSLQRHRKRAEHWFFVEGEAVVTRKAIVVYDPVPMESVLEGARSRTLLRKRATVAETPDEFVQAVRCLLERCPAGEEHCNDEFLMAYGVHQDDQRSARRAAEAVAGLWPRTAVG